MKLEVYQIDAFTDKIFGGNPACVVPLSSWLQDELLQKIAMENAVAETAFYTRDHDHYHLRWFTPEYEMDLCGHATLATAHVLKSIVGLPDEEIVFNTRSGLLNVHVHKEMYTLDFPSRKPAAATLPEIIAAAINIPPTAVYKARDYMLVYEQESDVKNIIINRAVFDQINLEPGGVIVTAKGDSCDFVSRFFTSQSSILEDPVTGSAHCSLIPYWSERLNKKEMIAFQISDRLGKLYCTDQGSRVWIAGTAKTYSMGSFWTE